MTKPHIPSSHLNSARHAPRGDMESTYASGAVHLDSRYTPARLPHGRVVDVVGDAWVRDPVSLQLRKLVVGDVIESASVVLTDQNGIIQIEPRALRPMVVPVQAEPAPRAPVPVDPAPKVVPGSLSEAYRVDRIHEAVSGNQYELDPAAVVPQGVEARRYAGGVGVAVNSIAVNEAAGTATFTVRLDHMADGVVRVGYSTGDGVATAGGDFEAVSGVLVFQPGEVSKTFTVPIVNDNLFEGAEDFRILLSPAPGTWVNPLSTGIGTIMDDGSGSIPPGATPDNDTPAASINDITVNEAAGTATFTVTMSNAAAMPVTVDYATANGGALAGADYTATSGTLTFAAGVISQTVTVGIINDTTFEGGESFFVNLANPSNATIADAQGAGTIMDDGTGSGGTDNDKPSLSVNLAAVLETAGFAVFTVSLSNPTQTAVSLSLVLAGVTATGGGVDYGSAGATNLQVSTDNGVTWANSTTATIAAGATSVLVRTPVIADALDENNETFSLTVTNLGATTTNSSVVANGVIIDTNAEPTLSISSLSVNEAIGTATFTVSMNRPADMPVTVSFATRAGTATNGLDYVGQTGTITFAPGEVSKTLGIQINQDTALELAESFFVDLTSPTNATIAQAVGECVINDNGTGAGGTDDDTPAFSINSVTINEDAGTATFTVSLDRSAGVPVSVNYATADGTALAGVDYTATSGTLTFAPGQTSRTITVSIANDGTYEGAENFSVNLSAASNATIAVASGLGTILDDGAGAGGTDDDRPAVKILGATVNEAIGTVFLTVQLDKPAAVPVTVNYASADGVALAGADYAAVSGTVTFAPGVTTQTIAVPIANDTVFEGAESFVVNLSGQTNSMLAPADAVGTVVIHDDGTGTGGANDDRGTVSVVGSTVDEAAGVVTFTLSLSSAQGLPVSVNYATADGTALAGADYTATSGTANFAAGQTTATVSVALINDRVVESTEAFQLNLTAPVNIHLGSSVATGTITDTDAAPVAASDSASGLNNVLLTGNVLINDSDPNGDPISVTGFSVGGTPYLPGASATIAGQGAIVINADGSYTFTPISTYVGNVSPITYTVSDGGNSTTSTLGITMTPGNAAPVVTQSLVYLSEEGTKYGHPDSVGAPVDMTNARIVTGTLNVVDPEGGPVTIDLVPLSSDSAPIFLKKPGVASWKSYDPTIFDPLSPAPGILLPSSYTGAASSKAIMLQYDGMPYLSLTIDDSGNYRAILMMDRSLAHAIPGVEDLLALGIGVRVSDGFNTTTVMNAIQLNVEDDSPVFTVSSSSQVIQQGTTVYGDLPEMGRYGYAVTLGADNNLFRPISSVQVDGVTYSFSPDLKVASASGSASWSYSGAGSPANPTSDGVLTVNTTSGGVLQLRASDGAYSYKAPSGLSSGYSEVLTYVATDSDGDSAARSYSIDVSATSAMNVMSATSFDENLTGTGGRDAIYGSAGWDTLSGGLGDDFIYGGVGQDSLYGGGGSDVFVWGSDTYATAEGQSYFGMSNRDFVRDYDVSPVSGGGDVVDLRGILWGESIALNNINNYINIDTTTSPGRALVSLSSQGDFSGGYVGTKTSQAIDLIGGNLNSALGLAAGATSAQIVAAMIAQGKLLVDN